MIINPSYSLFDFSELESTNTYATEQIKNEKDSMRDRMVFLARSQTKGKGRQGNSWENGFGNLFASILLLPKKMTAEQAGQMSFVTSLAVRKTIQYFLSDNKKAVLKWPNDILVEEKKINGILLESSFDREAQTQWLVIGIGVNLVEKPSLQTACSLCEFVENSPTVDQFLPRLIEEFELYYSSFLKEGFGMIRKEWLSHAYNLGKKIKVRLPDQEFTATFLDIDHKGRLLIEKEDGRRIEIASGDVFFYAEDSKR